jgi:hypothetical protein
LRSSGFSCRIPLTLTLSPKRGEGNLMKEDTVK